MPYYVCWGEVQKKMEHWASENQTMLTFPEAMSLLWKEGCVHESPRLPSVDFNRWNLEDLDQFSALTEDMPVDMSPFSTASGDFSFLQMPTYETPSNRLAPIRLSAYRASIRSTHSHYGIFYVLRGSGGISTTKGNIPCPQGTLCITAPEFVHDVYVDPNSNVISFGAWQKSLKGALQKLFLQDTLISEFFFTSLSRGGSGYLAMHLPADHQVRQLIRGTFHEGYSHDPYGEEISSGYLELLILLALRACTMEFSGMHPASLNGQVPMLTVLSYIQANFRTATLKTTAETFHYEVSYLSKQIKNSTGKTYTDIVRSLRITEAKRLLVSSRASLEQIAEQSGYHNQVHFFREFRAVVGVTPGMYRRDNAQQK